MTVVVVGMADRRTVVTGLRTGRLVMTVPQTGCDAYRRCQCDDSTDANENDRVGECWYRLAFVASIPDPASSHHDIDLQHQSAQVSGLYELRFAGMRAKRRSSGAGHRPERDGSNVEHDPGDENGLRRPSKYHSCPNQLEKRQCDEEQTRRHPLLPVRRSDGEMDDCRAERSDRRETRSELAVRPRGCFQCHPLMMTAPARPVFVRHHISTRPRRTRHTPSRIGLTDLYPAGVYCSYTPRGY